MNIQELKEKSSEKLITEAENLGIENASTLRRQEIYFAILKKLAEKGEEITGGGVLQLLQDGFGFLRAIESNYLPGADDIYIQQYVDEYECARCVHVELDGMRESDCILRNT